MKYNEETQEYEDWTDLEKEFEKARNEALPLIEKELKEIGVALRKAKEISEKYGVPFNVYGIGASNVYVPKSLREKFESVAGCADAREYFMLPYDIDYSGWQKSYC